MPHSSTSGLSISRTVFLETGLPLPLHNKQQADAKTTLPSAAKLTRMVRPDPDAFAIVLSVSISLLLAALSSRQSTLPVRHDWTTCRVSMRFEFALTCREMHGDSACCPVVADGK